MIKRFFTVEHDGGRDMANITRIASRKGAAETKGGLVILLLLAALLGGMCLTARTGYAEDSPEAAQLKEDAQKAFLGRDYARAAAINLAIARKYPQSEARHYAVQMLGTIYEDYTINLEKAIKWDREYLEKYANPRQVPFYKDKIASLEKLLSQEQAFKTYQSILFANKGDEVMVRRFEALLKEHPDFLLKDKVESELGYAYGRMDERKKSALAFKAIADEAGKKLSSGDKAAYDTADRYWRMRTTWAWAAWAVIVILWALVLVMKPWRQLTWPSVRKFLLWPAIWLALTGASMPFFFSMETTGYPIQIPLTALLTAIGLNLVVLFWLLLFTRGGLWQGRRRLLRSVSPFLALAMTVGVFYLFVVYYPKGPYIVDECSVKYEYWKQELQEWSLKHGGLGRWAWAPAKQPGLNTRDE
jgi:hypothetical protein